MKKFWFLSIIAIIVIWSCSSDNEEETVIDDDVALTFDRGAMLANWADNIILPSYQSFETDLATLKTAFDAFSTTKDAQNLADLREAWLDAYLGWQKVSMFEVGPAESVGLRLNMNIYPTDISLLESNIDSGNYNLSLPSNRDAKGFPAIDYLLNGLEVDDTSLVNRFSTSADADKLVAYMGDLIDDMIQLTSPVVDAWEGEYRGTFVTNDGSSATASVDRFVNDFIFYYEKFLRAGKMGIPLGVFSGTPAPNTIEAFYKVDISNQLFLTGLQAVQDFFNGKHFNSTTTGESLASYLVDLNTLKDGAALNELINNQFNEARSRVSALGTFRNEVENNNPPTNMLSAYNEVQKAVPLLKVDMVSALSISIDFVDADGD
jgi:hypothetical protein